MPPACLGNDTAEDLTAFGVSMFMDSTDQCKKVKSCRVNEALWTGRGGECWGTRDCRGLNSSTCV